MNNIALNLSSEQVSIIQNVGISAIRVVQGSTNNIICDITRGKYRFGKKHHASNDR